MMIENIVNTAQIVTLLFCVFCTLFHITRSRSRSWITLLFFYISYLLGDFYWQICLFYYNETPQISVVSDLSWYAAYIFMYLLIKRNMKQPHSGKDPKANRFRYGIPCLGPLFTAAMAVFYMLRGEIVSNIIYAAIMGMLFYTILVGLFLKDPRTAQKHRPLFVSSLGFCMLEYAEWTTSCFWENDICRNAYYVFDLLMTLCFLLFIHALQTEDTE